MTGFREFNSPTKLVFAGLATASSEAGGRFRRLGASLNPDISSNNWSEMAHFTWLSSALVSKEHFKCISLKVATKSLGLRVILKIFEDQMNFAMTHWMSWIFHNYTGFLKLNFISRLRKRRVKPRFFAGLCLLVLWTPRSNVWCLWRKRRMPGVAELQIFLHGTYRQLHMPDHDDPPKPSHRLTNGPSHSVFSQHQC